MARLITLMFHGVVPTIPECAMFQGGRTCLLRLDDFERTVRWCTQRYRVLHLAEVEGFLRSATDETAILLTFDDALASLVDYAVPVLVTHGVPATVFVTTDWTRQARTPAIFALERQLWMQTPREVRIESGGREFAGTIGSRRDVGRALGEIWSFLLASSTAPLVLEPRQVTLDGTPWNREGVPDLREFWFPAALPDLQRLAQDGVLDIGAHGATHIPWTMLPEETLQVELVRCRQELERWFDRPVEACSYPHGMVDARVGGQTGDVFSLAFTNQHGLATPDSRRSLLPRIHVASEPPFWPGGIVQRPRAAAAVRRLASIVGWS